MPIAVRKDDGWLRQLSPEEEAIYVRGLAALRHAGIDARVWKAALTRLTNAEKDFARWDKDYQRERTKRNQVSPRASLQWQPWWATVAHVSYARNFTPPDQALGRITQPQLLDGTTGAVTGVNFGVILPERSDVRRPVRTGHPAQRLQLR